MNQESPSNSSLDCSIALGEKSFAREAIVFAGLLLIVIFSWCSANGKWAVGSWQQPGAYSEAFTSDVLASLSGMKAVADGDIFPMSWKKISRLGAPSGANWNDAPLIEEIPFYLQGLMARWFGLFAGLNLSLLVGHLLAAGAFYAVARFSSCERKWSFVGGLAFGLAPFIFSQSPHHITVAYAWHVPFFIPVWKWVATGDGLGFGSKKFWIAVGIALLTGSQNVYYTNIFCQLTLLGGLAHYLRSRSVQPLLACLSIIAAAALAFALMNLDTWTYRLINGPNGGAVVREYKWLEIYGLKIVDLFVPPTTHRSDWLASFAFLHRSEAPLQDEGSYLGILGLLSLVFMVGVAVVAVVKKRYEEVPLGAWQSLWIVLAFTTGGLNAILGAMGFTLFRTGCRYSIVILAIALLFAVRRMSVLPISARLSTLLAVLACVLVFADQVPRPPSREQTAQVARCMESDRQLVGAMESALPSGAMVFQIPIMEFPESPVPGLSPYDQLRPYLFSKSLRFSFGSMKGRSDTQWQKDLQKIPLPDAVSKIRSMGFQAILISRNGFPDKGQGILKALADMGYKTVIDSPAGDMTCVLFSNPTMPLNKS